MSGYLFAPDGQRFRRALVSAMGVIVMVEFVLFVIGLVHPEPPMAWGMVWFLVCVLAVEVVITGVTIIVTSRKPRHAADAPVNGLDPTASLLYMVTVMLLMTGDGLIGHSTPLAVLCGVVAIGVVVFIVRNHPPRWQRQKASARVRP
jgi:uncharacterized membrane protein YhaH (DUF805 family)